ncbi:HECT-domain-containing protein [Auriscalpium vulgare]|uniref:HECT-domain-containing protein n=1 Tax=Auriscalpium vulgare TaxID=40419 RepID=A0ACB8R7P6_9AGAM|nr:HECT-domain-containing protein [Auriscalpium vulgare]
MFILGQEKRRRINLGGATSASSHVDILHQAKAQRSQRQDSRKRQESAAHIQAWWRGVCRRRAVKRELRLLFEADALGLNGLRALVLIGRNEEVLAQWSSAVLQEGEGAILQHFVGPERNSWLVLVRRAALLILQSAADFPQSQHTVAHLRVLDVLLSPSIAPRVLGPQGAEVTLEFTRYFLGHNLYPLLAKAISGIPIELKSSAALPLIVLLLTYPFQTINPAHSELYIAAYTQLLIGPFSLPLLPNRLPLQSITHIAANFPLSNISILASSILEVVEALATEARVHLLANLVAFVPPRYAKLDSSSLNTILQLFTALMDALPTHALDPPSRKTSVASRKHALDDSSDSESESEDITRVIAVNAFVPPPPPLPTLDARTLTRLTTLVSTGHITSLLTTTQRHPSTRPSLYAFVLSLCTVWPKQADSVLSHIVVSNGGGIARELYKGYVRSSGLGSDDSPTGLTDPARAKSWPTLLFLVDLYSTMLLTMGDDEFFSSGKNNAPRNPLTLDELTAFSRQLRNIAFTLYWREDQTDVQEGRVPGVALKWEGVREKVTKCLLALHARDSRKPFTPPGHWLVTAQIDMSSFIEAAVFEEQQIAQPVGAKALTKRQISYLSPRLGVLNNIPFTIPFEVRVSILRNFIANDMQNRGIDRHDLHRRARATVRRGHVAEDGFDKLGEADLKQPIEITFIDQFGEQEMGIDGGGVFKEFLTDLAKEVFDSNRGLWLVNKNNELYPNPGQYATEPHSLNWYRFIGRILGKALYEGILVDVVFASFFLAKWLGKQSFLDDLESLDPELYQGLVFLKHYTGDPEDLALNFTISDEEFGVAKTIELVPHGSNIAVTRSNRLEYIHRVSHYRLTRQIKRQSDAFFEGLSDMIDVKWLRMFNQQELQILLGGVNTPVDLQDLRKHTNYGGLYADDHPTIVAFWNVANTLNPEQRRLMVRFVTSVGRPPLLGFKELVPNFSIRDAGEDQSRLPTSSTCVNLLKLPRYKSEKVLKDKLLQAITSGAGFDLS